MAFQESEIVVGSGVIYAWWNPATGDVADIYGEAQGWDSIGTYDGEVRERGGLWHLSPDVSAPEMIRRIAGAGGTGVVVDTVRAQYGAAFDTDRELV